MLERLLNLPDKFWQRLGIIFLAYAFAQIAIRKIPLPLPFYPDRTFVTVVFFILCFVGIRLAIFSVPKILNNPFGIYIISQSIFFWIIVDRAVSKLIHISYKPQALIFGLIMVAGIYYFFKNFNFLWKFTEFRLVTIFLIINIIYYFFYYSDFNISKLARSAAAVGGDSENKPAKLVIFLSSLSVFLTSVIGLSLFKDQKTQDEFKKLIFNLTKIFSIFFALMIPFLIIIGSLRGLSFHLSAPIYFIILLTFKYYLDNFSKVSFKFKIFLLFNIITFFVLTVMSSNKTSLIAFLFSLLIYLIINFKEKLSFKTFDFLEKGILRFILIPLIAGIFIFFMAHFGLFDLIIEKINKAFHGISSNAGVNSFYIRKNNWKYFIDYWENNLDFLKVLFGFGIGKSREIIYYISSSQYSFLYKVQTTHNHYIDMFFEYGLMSLFYFLPIIIIFIKSIINIFNKKISKEIKLLSNMSIQLISFYFIYHLADGLRVTTAIIFFSILMFAEGFKYCNASGEAGSAVLISQAKQDS